MKAVILAGGYGTRISEESLLKPKPLIEIGGMPILWHIMKLYSHYNINEFVICCGYKGYMIKEYFANYFLHTSDISIDIQKNSLNIHNNNAEPWHITLVDTGIKTMTGGRLKRVQKYIDNSTFCFTYGDGLSNVNLSHLIDFHNQQNTAATITAVQPPGRFGNLSITNTTVVSFMEKPMGDGNWINGGYFVLEPSVFDYLSDDSTIWENDPLQQLVEDKQLSAFKHDGFWHPLDTLRDRNHLEHLWNENKADWKVW